MKRAHKTTAVMAVLLTLSLLAACAQKEYEVGHLATGAASAPTAAEGGLNGPFGSAGTEEQKETDAEPGTSGGGSGESSQPGSVESGGQSETESGGESGEDTGSIFGRTDEGGSDESGGTGSGDYPGEGGFVVNEGPNTAYQLTDADIQQMNNGKAVIVRSNNGYVSTLVGRWYDKKITVRPNDIQTFEEAISSLNGLATMLGFRAGTEFFAAYGSQDKEGYTYLTYQQRYGGITVENATMHIVIDPEGYTCAVSCSFAPELGFSAAEPTMTAEEAIAYVRNFAAQYGYTDLRVYEEATVRAAIPVYTQIHNCYVVFTDNAEGESGFENLRYWKWFISCEENAQQPVLMLLPSSTLTVSQDTSYYPTNEYFENLEPVTWSGELNLMNEGVKHVEITVSYNTLDGRYYLIDPIRKIAIADCYEFLYGQGLQLYSNSENQWAERDLAALYNYAAAYDAYARIGIKAPDGFETPILLLREFCDQNRQPENNACYMAQFNGWFTFCYSTVNDLCYDLDVIGHEYTHAVTEACIMGNNYVNDAGAINEAYSDIMGNLIEYMAGRTTDTLWLNGENSNEAIRQMSDPTVFHQPDCVGGPYYVPGVAVPIQNFNDNGGVHTNSGIINYAAYLMYTSGMDYATMFDLFYTSMNILTPANDFEDVYAALIYSARSNGYTAFEDAITQAFMANGVLDPSKANAPREGYGRFTMSTPVHDRYMFMLITFDPQTGQSVSFFWPDQNGQVNLMTKEGYYYVELMLLDMSTGSTQEFMYADGWTQQASQDALMYLSSGQTIHMQDIVN